MAAEITGRLRGSKLLVVSFPPPAHPLLPVLALREVTPPSRGDGVFGDMDCKSGVVVACLSVILFPQPAIAACAVDRAPVRTGADAQAAQVVPVPVPATIATLHSIPAPRPLPQDGRIAPVETTTYLVTATLTAYRIMSDGEIQLVLSDEARRTITASIPAPACASGSRFLSSIASARSNFTRRYGPTETFTEVRQPIEVQGIGFFDFFRGQRGLAPNGMTLQPVTAIDLTPAFQPKAPPPAARRRSAGSGGTPACARPSLSITASRGSACAGEPVTIAWQSSDAAAIVTIDGIGTSLPASGSRSVTATASAAFSGRARTSCGLGDESVAVVTITPAATALLSGPATVISGSSATLTFTIGGASSWTLSSSLGNAISPSSGTSSGSATYTASRTGIDTVTLTASGGTCGSISRTLSILVSAPPTSNLGLRCCDGTRSPTCFSCSNQRGCCSGHRGVCDCQ